MADSYQKIINDIDSNCVRLRDADCWHEANTLDGYKKRLEALRENPYHWMNKEGTVRPRYVLCAHTEYPIPLIRGD